MRETFLNTPEGMQWLRDAHGIGVGRAFRSAILEGNEGCPRTVTCYWNYNPTIDEPPAFVWHNPEWRE